MSDNTNLIETICIKNGKVQRIQYHNDRCSIARKSLFDIDTKINLRKYVDTSLAPSSLTKCRITYNREVIKVDYEPYTLKPINSLKLIDIGDYSYAHKYQDRSTLSSFYNQRGESDDILMIKNGLVTDTYYANVALLRDSVWYTPENPLLKGTMRSYLIKKGNIVPASIRADHLKEYQSIRLLNAMMKFGSVAFSVNKIVV